MAVYGSAMYTLTQNRCLNYSRTTDIPSLNSLTKHSLPISYYPHTNTPTHPPHFNNPHIHPQSGTGHMACLANQSLA